MTQPNGQPSWSITFMNNDEGYRTSMIQSLEEGKQINAVVACLEMAAILEAMAKDATGDMEMNPVIQEFREACAAPNKFFNKRNDLLAQLSDEELKIASQNQGMLTDFDNL